MVRAQVWCEDFLGAGNISRPASCCHQDDDIALGWCTQPGSASDPRYDSACSPWHPDFGTINWAVTEDGSLQEADPSYWKDVTHESGFCEVLGRVRAVPPPSVRADAACRSSGV